MRPGTRHGIGTFVISLAVPEVIGGDGGAGVGKKAAVHLVTQPVGVSREYLIFFAQPVVAAESERPLVEVGRRETEVILTNQRIHPRIGGHRGYAENILGEWAQISHRKLVILERRL